MFHQARQNQNLPVAQPAKGANHRRIQRAFSLLQLASVLIFGLFIAGIVVPSFLRSEIAANQALAGGSLHALTIAGVTFSYTIKSLASALLGGLFGSLIVLAIEFPASVAKTAKIFLVFRQVDWKGLFSRQRNDPSYFSNRNLA